MIVFWEYWYEVNIAPYIFVRHLARTRSHTVGAVQCREWPGRIVKYVDRFLIVNRLGKIGIILDLSLFLVMCV